MHRGFHGTNVAEWMEARTMEELEGEAYRRYDPTIERFKSMRLPLTLKAYVARLDKLYRVLDGSKFVPVEITPNTWIGNTPTLQEERYARGLLAELYSSMRPAQKPANGDEYKRNIERVGRLVADTRFYFPLPQPVQANPWETADKVTKELKRRMKKDS